MLNLGICCGLTTLQATFLHGCCIIQSFLCQITKSRVLFECPIGAILLFCLLMFIVFMVRVCIVDVRCGSRHLFSNLFFFVVNILAGANSSGSDVVCVAPPCVGTRQLQLGPTPEEPQKPAARVVLILGCSSDGGASGSRKIIDRLINLMRMIEQKGILLNENERRESPYLISI